MRGSHQHQGFQPSKVARGETASLGGEYAWGTTTYTLPVTFSGSPEDGSTTITTANANFNSDNPTFSQGDDFLGAQYARGPLRAGIFATSSSTRVTSGAGYYGVMELSGNLEEFTISVANTQGTAYFAVNGDGQLCPLSGDTTNARQLGWTGTPQSTGAGASGVTIFGGTGRRGGSWQMAPEASRTSDRSAAPHGITTATNRFSGRGVRSVSPPSLPTCGNSVEERPEQCDDGNTTSGDNCSSACECEHSTGTGC